MSHVTGRKKIAVPSTRPDGPDTAPNLPEAPPEYRWLLLFGVWVLYAAFGLAATSLAPLVGLIESDLNLSHVQMGTTMGAWQLVYIFSAIPGGMLLDKIGGFGVTPVHVPTR